MNTPTTPLPKWKCHKTVHALKLTIVRIFRDGTAELEPEDKRFAAIKVDAEWVRRFKPKDGDNGYFVVYDDGYESWSPSKAFEEGYTLIS